MLDCVVLGTGYAAHRVAERAREACARPDGSGPEAGLRIGVAGRSRDKIASVQRSLGDASCPAIVADVRDAESLRAMARQCRCVINCVGPYM